MSSKKFLDEINQMSDSPFKEGYLSFRIKAMFDKKEDMADGFIDLIQKTNVKKTLEHIQKLRDIAEIVGKVSEFMDILYMIINSTKFKGNQEIRLELFHIYKSLRFKNLKNKEIEKLNKKISTTITGFKSSLSDTQIQTLFGKLKDNYIDKNTNSNHFEAIFKDEPLPEIEIIWIDKSTTRHEPNKQTIFEFFYLLKEHKYLKEDGFNTKASNQNNFYRKLETIFPNLNNFPESNAEGKATKNTRRKNELEKIILSLKS